MSAPSDEEIERLMAQHGPKRPPAYAMLAGSETLVRRLREKGASFETIRQILRTREVTVSESTLRNYCQEVLGEKPSVEVMISRAGRPGGLRKGMRTRVNATAPAAEPIPPATPEPQVPPAAAGDTAPATSGDDHASGAARTRGPRIAQLKRSATP